MCCTVWFVKRIHICSIYATSSEFKWKKDTQKNYISYFLQYIQGSLLLCPKTLSQVRRSDLRRAFTEATNETLTYAKTVSTESSFFIFFFMQTQYHHLFFLNPLQIHQFRRLVGLCIIFFFFSLERLKENHHHCKTWVSKLIFQDSKLDWFDSISRVTFSQGNLVSNWLKYIEDKSFALSRFHGKWRMSWMI